VADAHTDPAHVSSVLTAEQFEFLLSQPVARLATVDEHAEPHALPVCFAVHGGAIYVPLDGKPKRVPVERLRRVRDLQANPRVCIVVDRYDEDWTLLRWLQVRGSATVIGPGEEQAAAVTALRLRYHQYRAMALAEAPVIRITPERAVEWAWSGRPG
jgi:PPOX class probable F420-dependent enzyme